MSEGRKTDFAAAVKDELQEMRHEGFRIGHYDSALGLLLGACQRCEKALVNWDQDKVRRKLGNRMVILAAIIQGIVEDLGLSID